MTKHTISYADEIFYGDAYFAPYNSAKGRRGVQITPSAWIDIGAVVVADPDGLVLSVDPASGATFSLRATVAGQTNTGGIITLDQARNVTITTSADETTKSILITGTDIYGTVMSERITGPNTTVASGKKAFKTITSIVATGDMAALTIGFGDVLGLPFRIEDKNQIGVMFDGAADAATIVIGDATTATTTTGDVRGTIDLSGTLNGTKKVAVNFMKLNVTSKESLFGITQA